jgi:hypothetical protein
MTEKVEPNPMGQRARMTVAVLGGVYLVVTVAWLFASQANKLIGIEDTFQVSMMRFGQFFAVVAPALWFFTTFAQIKPTTLRIIVLALGLIVLFPFPLFFGVTGA